MNYYKHLVKINSVENDGRHRDLWRLVLAYNLNYLFKRPIFVKLLFSGRHRLQKKIIYTVLVGDYDRLNEISEKLDNWHYVCFTDNPGLTSKTWDVRLLENKEGLDPVRLSRHFKINNHLVDAEYDLSVYVDGNIRIRGDLDCFLAHALQAGSTFSILMHPFLNSLEQEVEQCMRIKKDRRDLLRKQYEHYVSDEGFNDPFPHINARMMIRRAGDPLVRRLMETWWSQLLRWSKRDQVSFNYSLSRYSNVAVNYIPYWIFRCYFKKMDHY